MGGTGCHLVLVTMEFAPMMSRMTGLVKTPARSAEAPPWRRVLWQGAVLTLDGRNVLWWPDEETLLVADLHLEKGSSYAAAGRMLPPYDTDTTLARLAAVVEDWRPMRVICLGDSFHDRQASGRLSETARRRLHALQARVADWVWICGNHDPEIPQDCGGRSQHSLTLGGLHLTHQPDLPIRGPQICGHFHPKVTLRVHGRRLRCGCFTLFDDLMVMPSFGAFTGGLNVLDPAIASLRTDRPKLYATRKGRIVQAL